MKCTDLEALLCDYVDSTLSAAEKATVELHLAGCQACRELVDDARAAVVFMGKAAEVEPPPALVNHILFEARTGKSAPVKKSGAKGWIGRLLEPVLQPKFAMGMAMTILSFSMLARFAGIPVRQLKPADLEPAKVWATLEDKAVRSYERAKKYYENLRLVYEIQQTLRDWSETDASRAQSQTANDGAIQARPQGESEKNRGDGRAKQ